MKRQNGEPALQESGLFAVKSCHVRAGHGGKRALRMFAAFAENERGGTALEYCFIAFLISIVAITAMTQIGVQTLANTASILPGLAR